MQFNNPIVGGDTLVRDAIHSQNYLAGSAGWTINRNGSAEFNNIIIRNGESVGGIQLFYSGTPALGNLIASISDTQGTDTYGNTYFVGVCSYDPTHGLFTQLLDGQLFSGLMTDAIAQCAQVGYNTVTTVERGTYPGVELIAPKDTTFTYQGSVLATPGNDSTVANGPRVYIIERNGNANVHATISGTLQKSDIAGSILTTQIIGAVGAPTYNTGWQAASTYGTIGACESLRFRALPDGRIHLHGAYGTGGTAPTVNALFTLPTGYYRTDRVSLFTWRGQISNTGNEVYGSGSILTNGAVQVSSTNTTSSTPRVANSTYWINTTFDGPDVQ